MWADYFDSQKVQYAFFSAADAVVLQQARLQDLDSHGDNEHDDGDDDDDNQSTSSSASSSIASLREDPEEGDDPPESEDDDDNEDDMYFSAEEEDGEGKENEQQDLRTKVLGVPELEALFAHAAPSPSGKSSPLLSLKAIDSNAHFHFSPITRIRRRLRRYLNEVGHRARRIPKRRQV